MTRKSNRAGEEKRKIGKVENLETETQIDPLPSDLKLIAVNNGAASSLKAATKGTKGAKSIQVFWPAKYAKPRERKSELKP